MKKIIVILFTWSALQSFAQRTKNETSHYLQKCISSYNRMYKCDEKYSENKSDSYQDCVIMYNKILIKLLSNESFFKLNESSLKKLSSSTGLKVLKSKDGKLRIVSWSIFTTAPDPSCSNIFVTHGNSMILYSDSEDKNTQMDVQFDTIYNLKINNHIYYLLMGINKCGTFCTKKICSLFTIKNSKIIHCDSAFFIDGKYLSNIEIQYALSKNLGNGPDIKLDGSKLILPVMSNDKMSVVGHDISEIKPH